MAYDCIQLEQLGQGSYGTVFKSKSRLTGEIFAIKEIRIDQNEGISATTMNEIAIIKELRHPNIVKLHDVQVNETKISLVFEYCDHDLWKYMQGNGLLDPSIVRTFMKQLLLGISDCHASGFHHRDLKPQNLLIDNNRALKIADFGMAKTYDLPIDKHSKDAVTLWYRAPELLLGSTSYTTSVDIWSIGCIFAEMLCGKAFFQGRDDQTQLNKIMLAMGTPSAAQYRNMKCGYIPRLETSYVGIPLVHMIPCAPSDALDLLGYFLKYNPAERISATQALDHPYFTNAQEQHHLPRGMPPVHSQAAPRPRFNIYTPLQPPIRPGPRRQAYV